MTNNKAEANKTHRTFVELFKKIGIGKLLKKHGLNVEAYKKANDKQSYLINVFLPLKDELMLTYIEAGFQFDTFCLLLWARETENKDTSFAKAIEKTVKGLH